MRPSSSQWPSPPKGLLAGLRDTCWQYPAQRHGHPHLLHTGLRPDSSGRSSLAWALFYHGSPKEIILCPVPGDQRGILTFILSHKKKQDPEEFRREISNLSMDQKDLLEETLRCLVSNSSPPQNNFYGGGIVPTLKQTNRKPTFSRFTCRKGWPYDVD